ncbi:micrococcal nuclease [Collimonas sp. OK242]|uniref:thermonuclease family protein n=1 Tax=Collimonas sp. OK242 TaxID=1798195 RepID=UPI00089AA1B8|nr:thermonuclease family protein [Collimonas sp. OK242]SDY44815.1 micrococcal nuclease [Collimonas sp. OK242]
MRISLATLLLLAPLLAHAYEVISVGDGDSMTLQVGPRRLKLRLAGIDAPEIKQAFGPQARQSLHQLCFGKDVQYEAEAIDRFNRTIATVRCNGIDASRAQLERGMAWAFRQKDRNLKALETAARNKKIGLWSDPHAVAPWRFRYAGSQDATCHVGARGGRYRWVNGRKMYGCP